MTALERVTDAVRAEMDRQEDVGTYQPELVARAALLAIRESEPTAWICLTDVGKGRSHIIRSLTEDRENADQCAKLSYWSVTPLHDIDAILNETPE